MTTANRAYNANTMRNFCAEIDIFNVRKFQATGGITNETYLIADTFLIMFANQYVDSYLYETMDMLKGNKNLCKFGIKKVCNEITSWLDNYNKEYYGCMSRNSQCNVADMGVSLDSALEDSMRSPTSEVRSYVDKNYTNNQEFITRLLISVMLTDWAVVYMKSRINESIKENPIIIKVTWMSHEELRRLVYKLDAFFKTPKKINDIKIHAQWCKFQKLWCNSDFIADNLGEGQPTDYVDGSTTQVELKELFNKKQISKN